MKKSLLSLAIISATTIASAEVKLSGQVGVDLTSKNGSRAVFSTKSTRLQIDANQDIGGGNEAYARVRLNLANDGGAVTSNKGYVGIKGSFGDVSFGDAGSGCGYTEVGGVGVTSAQKLDGYADAAGCGSSITIRPRFVAAFGKSGSNYYDGIDPTDGAQNIRYTNDFGNVKVGASYHPGKAENGDRLSLGISGDFGPVKASLGYTDYSSIQEDIQGDTVLLGLEGNFGDFKIGAQYSMSDYTEIDALGSLEDDVKGWEIGVNYALQSGDIYAGYGHNDIETKLDGSVFDEARYNGWMLGYKHNISDRTWTWIEIGDFEDHDKISWSTGLMHKF